jgi:GNAT superfamily N-acetyltransferase
LAADELFRAPHYRKHIELFPAGQFVALDGEHVVGMTSTIRYKIDFEHPEHTFSELLEGGWMTSHDPDGDWLYGMDMGTHPDYRKRGIARGLYRARQEAARKLGLRGQVAGGMMSGYGAVKDKMTAQEYFAKLKAGEIYDPTISTQMRVGFRAEALLPNYLNDPVCDNWGVLIVLDADQEVESS